jgi:hypothetical protein
MGMALTREQVLALAPDAASAKAAGGLVAESKWVSLGADEAAVWGECQGSGSKPYQAQVDLTALVSRCSCPSRKFPCKHALALLLLYAQAHPRFAGGVQPDWVEQWLASRRERGEKKEKAEAAGAAKAATDPAAAAAAVAKRESARWKRIEAGCAELQRWIADQFRRGLASLGAEQRRDGLAMAARMVDAQAPGLGPRVQQALELGMAGAAHYPDAVARFGLLQLINEGVRRRERLSPARLADLRNALGWAADKDEVLAAGEAVTDRWQVLGQATIELDAKLSERRVWLAGVRSRRYALLQEFSYAGKGWERAWQHGAEYDAELRFYPGSVPLRAIAQGVANPGQAAVCRVDPADAAFELASQAFASNPWLAQFPLSIDAATPFRAATGWRLHTAAGSLPLRIGEASGWSLLAFSGGHPVALMGEWNGAELRPLSARESAREPGGAVWAAEAGE